MRPLVAVLLLLSTAGLAVAQSDAERAADGAISADFAADAAVTYFSQAWLDETMELRSAESIRDVPRVHYDYYIIPEGQNRLEARLSLYRRFGGDREVIKPLLWLLNRNDLENLYPGDTLVVPTHFGLDFRAYSPFPRYYPGAADLDQIVILDKQIQAWGAYANGELERWGILNTGAESSRTPSGRFNVNWKQEYRVSTLSPGYGSSDPDAELWEMYWVMNLHEQRGIHMHQYALPTSGPASHGCIRLLEADAKWLYEWTDTWDVENQREHISSAGGRITDQGTMVLIIGEDISEPAQPFLHRERYPVIRMVNLPPDPYAVPPGTEQQRAFDRLAGRS
ncbi:MAG: L,D-transpeptidase [Bacteroidota bacterium]